LDDATSRFYVDKASDSLDDDAQALPVAIYTAHLHGCSLCVVVLVDLGPSSPVAGNEAPHVISAAKSV
jgi:hypothetical protein